MYSPVGGVFADEVAGAGAVVRVLPRRFPKFDPGWVRTLAGHMRQDDVELVHTHLFGDSLHGYLAARSAGQLPVVTTLHAVAGFHSRVQRLGYRWLLPRVARAVACSDAVRRSFVAELGGRPAALELIPNGVALPSPERGAPVELGGERGALVVAGIGRLVPEKNFASLIDAVALLWKERLPVRLLLLGDGPLRGQLEARAAASGIAEWVTLPGFRPDVPALLRTIDVVAFSSFDEGLPMALLEAMAAGRCVVATDVGGIPGAVRNEQEALLVPPRDVSALAGALRRVLHDGALRQRLGAAAERRVRECFTAERMVDAYVRLYRDVLAERRGAPRRAANDA